MSELLGDLGGMYRELASDSQLRWLGPEKGVEHLALAAVMNARLGYGCPRAGKPLWRLLADMTPEELVDVADLRYSPTPSPGRRPGDPAAGGSRPRGADRAAGGTGRLSLLHHECRLARLLR